MHIKHSISVKRLLADYTTMLFALISNMQSLAVTTYCFCVSSANTPGNILQCISKFEQVEVISLDII